MGSRISEASYYNGYKRPSNSGKCALKTVTGRQEESLCHVSNSW